MLTFLRQLRQHHNGTLHASTRSSASGTCAQPPLTASAADPGPSGSSSSGHAAAPPSGTETPLLTDFLAPCDQWPVQVSLEQLVELSERHQLATVVWIFAPLLEGESLQQHVERHGLEACPGPHQEVWNRMGWRHARGHT